MSYFLAFGGFAALILLHEFGHFIAAKRVGMRVERFSLFFPPLLVRKKRGETEYAIGAVPLGGYVKITGMNPQEELPPDIAPRSYYHQPVWKRIVVIGAGPAMNVLVALVLLFLVYMFAPFGEVTPVVGTVKAKAPASGVLKPGDRIVSVDGKRGNPNDFRAQIGKHKCVGKQVQGCRARQPVRLVVLRDGKTVKLSAYPEYDAQTNPPSPRLGFIYMSRRVEYGPVAAAGQSVSVSWEITERTFEAIARIFKPEARKQISGVVGGYKATEESFSFDIWQAIFVLAIISLSLALINLFPFLPLDGGHIFFSLVEKVRGRAVPFAIMERASVLGFMLVIMLFAIGLSNDIGRLTSGKDFIPK